MRTPRWTIALSTVRSVGSIGALAVVLAAGCEHDRVMLTLSGDAPGATQIDVVLAEPYATDRLQRLVEPEPPAPPTGKSEPAFYIAQRARVTFTLDPARPLAGTQLQLDVPTREPFVPILVARDAGGRIVGMGAYEVDRLFIEGVTPSMQLLSDVTFYDVALEPVMEREPGRIGVAPGEVAVVTCDDKPSGYAWRRRAGTAELQPQLRVVLPLGGGDGSATSRLHDAVDLDCDNHSPGIGGIAVAHVAPPPENEGDRLDCDDIDRATGPDAEERCNGRDDDCDGELDPLHVVSGTCTSIPEGCANVVLCDESTSTAELCVTTSHGCDGSLRCPIPYEATASGVRPCNDVRGTFDRIGLQFNPCAESGCTVMLVDVDPRWEVRIGDEDAPNNQLYEPYKMTASQGLGIHAKSSELFQPNDEPGRFTIYVSPSSMAPPFVITYRLDLRERDSTQTMCQTEPYVCGSPPSPMP